MKTRADSIKESYLNAGFQESTISYSRQLSYEMEMDFRAVKTAISYLSEFIDYRNRNQETHTFGEHNVDFALECLVKRASEYSCPSNLKDEHKTKDKCPLKEGCKCVE